MKRKHTTSVLVALVGAMVSLSAMTAMAAEGKGRTPKREAELGADVRREGTGDRREKLLNQELSAFNFELIKLLSDAKGELPTADSIKGKPLVLLTLSAWTPGSKTAVGKVAAVVKKFAGSGVTVLAVHSDKRFEDGIKLLEEQKLDWTIAKDAGGKFRAAILSDGDPDVFVIDRAGQLRFADIETDSLEKALEVVSLETAEAAVQKFEQLKTAAVAAKINAEKTVAVGDVYRPGVKIHGDYVQPSAAEYDKTLWPRKNSKEAVSQQVTDIQEEELPKEILGFADTVEWFSPRPALAELAGKVTVLEFWATWCGPCKKAKPMLDDLCEKNRDDLTMIAFSGYDDPKFKVQDYLRRNPSELIQVYEPEGKVYKALGINAIPLALVMSTDGKVRWMGNPLDPSFRSTVEEVIAKDPGVAARRKADKEAIKARGG